MSQEIILSPASSLDPAPLFTPTPQAAQRMLEFFTAQINNPHTRRAYLNASRRFAAWCQQHRLAAGPPVRHQDSRSVPKIGDHQPALSRSLLR